MSRLTDDLKKYANKSDLTHIKNKFFNRLVNLLNENQLTVSTLTSELARLNKKDRKLLFDTLIESPSVNSDAAVWIRTLYELMGVPLRTDTLRLLIENKPSDRLVSQLVNARYRLWQKSPFDENKIKHLEHELKGAIGLLSKDMEGISLVDLLMNSLNHTVEQVLHIILELAPGYLPQVLEHIHKKCTLEDQQLFVERLLDSNDPKGKVLNALLRSSPAIVTRMVIIKPELYFKASESMRIAVRQSLQEKKDFITINKISQVANNFFSADEPDLQSKRIRLVLDGSYRFKEVRLSQTEQALNAIRTYVEQQPSDYKQQFFNKLAHDIKLHGLTVELLRNNLRQTDRGELFAKWSGWSNSRAAGLMVSLYKLASFGIELDFDELNRMVLNGELPQVPSAPDSLPGQSNMMTWLHSMVFNEIKDEAPQLLYQDQKESSLKIIQTYLAKQPDQYKADFFLDLAQDIDKNGLTLGLLQGYLDRADTDNNKLFSKWSGLTYSRAAEVMAALYNNASIGRVLDAKQLKEMVYQKRLPEVINSSDSLVHSKIREIIMNPDRSNSSHLAAKIGQEFEKIQAKAQFLQNNQYRDSLIMEATYQKYILKKGIAIAEHQSNPVFDPQEHVMVFVDLGEEDYQNILAELGLNCGENVTAKATVQYLLGSEITDSNLCNLDIKNNINLETKFKQWINNDSVFGLLTNSEDRSSIIGLQEEMTMHVLLSLRVLENKIPLVNTLNVRQNLLTAVNDLVKTEFKLAVTKAYSSDHNKIDYVVLNKELDKAREKLAPLCQQELVDLMFAANPDIDWDAKLRTIKKHDFTSTTATGLDYLRSDVRNKTLVRIGATECTAHDKNLGADTQAFRVIHRNHYGAEEDLVTPYQYKTVEARVPSIAVKESSQQVGIKDVADKLQASHRLLRKQVAYSNGPMVYNLLTSLHTLAYDNFFFERPNRQRLSAEYILQGSHLYNLRQLRHGEPKDLVYVQNIPVNQHTNELDDSAFDDVTKEATLMTDLALLSTLNHYAGVFPCALQHSISQSFSNAHHQYLAFLPRVEHKDFYFHQSEQGNLVTDSLNHNKSQWNTVDIESSKSDSLNTLVVKALFKMYSSNDYRNKQLGMLVQSLSVFVEPMSQAGCKSANERYQGVSGRVELLKSISTRSDDQMSPEEKSVKSMLHLFVSGDASGTELQQSLDTAYNKHNLYGAAVVFSEEDQGAASKVKATKNKADKGVISELDTNVAESGFLTRLHQSFCSVMQAHKANLVELFKKLFHEKVQSSSSEIRLQ